MCGMNIITARKRSLGQGNVFTGVYHPFCPKREVCIQGCLHPERVFIQGGSASRESLHLGGVGVCIQRERGSASGWSPSRGRGFYIQGEGSLHPGGICLQGVLHQMGLHPGGSGGLHPKGEGVLHPGKGGLHSGGLGRSPEHYGIRSTSRRYASYWNAFLFRSILICIESGMSS